MPALSFFGCLQYLEHVGLLPGVDTFVGSSAGSIVGFMTVIGFTPREACDFFMETGVKIHTVTELDVFDAMFGQQTFLDTLGFDDGTRWLAFLSDALEMKRGCRDITFRDLAKSTGKVLTVCVTNLTRVCREYLSVDTTPDMSVILALRMSLSVPVLYAPVLYQGSIYVDGSVLDNFPINTSASLRGGPPTTLALYIETDKTGEGISWPAPCEGLPSPVQYMALLLGVIVSHAQSNNGNTAGKPEDHITSVGVPVPASDAMTCGFSLRSFAFDINQERLDDLVARGYAAARLHIEPILLDSSAMHE